MWLYVFKATGCHWMSPHDKWNCQSSLEASSLLNLNSHPSYHCILYCWDIDALSESLNNNAIFSYHLSLLYRTPYSPFHHYPHLWVSRVSFSHNLACQCNVQLPAKIFQMSPSHMDASYSKPTEDFPKCVFMQQTRMDQDEFSNLCLWHKIRPKSDQWSLK